MESTVVMMNVMKRSNLIKERTHNDTFFTAFMALVWADSILLRYIRVLLQMIPYIWQQADMILMLGFIITLGLSLGAILRTLYIKEMFYVMVMYAVFYLHFYGYPLNTTYFYNQGGITITECFPMFLIGLCAYRINRENTMKIMYLISVASIFAFVLYTTVFSRIDSSTLRNGDMHGAYTILPHLCLAFMGVLRKPNAWNIGAFTIGAVFLLFLGNRGSLLCLGVCVIATILFSGRLKKPWLFLCLSAMAMAILFLFGLLDFLHNMAEKYEFSLRIFQKLESGEIAASSGRDRIQDRVWEYIWMYPMMGMGLFSDRRVAGGYYAHNIIPEVLIHHGMIVGIILLCLVAYLLVGTYRYLRKENHLAKDVYGALLFSVVFKLFLSSSYLMEPYFFFTLGFACAAMSEYRNIKRQERDVKERTGLVRLRRIRS